jgi:hypothetical protein
MKIFKQLFWFGLVFYIFVALFIGLVTVNLYSLLTDKISVKKRTTEIKSEYVDDFTNLDTQTKKVIYDTVFVEKAKPKPVENNLKIQTRDTVRDTTVIKTNDSTKIL